MLAPTRRVGGDEFVEDRADRVARRARQQGIAIERGEAGIGLARVQLAPRDGTVLVLGEGEGRSMRKAQQAAARAALEAVDVDDEDAGEDEDEG